MQDGDIMTYTKIRFLHPPGPYRTRLGGHKVIRDKLGHPSENIHQAVLANLFVFRVDSWRFA